MNFNPGEMEYSQGNGLLEDSIIKESWEMYITVYLVRLDLCYLKGK